MTPSSFAETACWRIVLHVVGSVSVRMAKKICSIYIAHHLVSPPA